MIRDLRKKFILVAMLSTMLVLTAIMGVVNFSNYKEVLDRADEMTALLAQNDGKFPEEPSHRDLGNTEDQSTSDAHVDNGMNDGAETPPAKPEDDKKDRSRFSVETPFEERQGKMRKLRTVIWTGLQRSMKKLRRNIHRLYRKREKLQDFRESIVTEWYRQRTDRSMSFWTAAGRYRISKLYL